MSQTIISPYLIQLFEAECRIVDQLLSGSQTQRKKTLRKPTWLRNRQLPAALQSSTCSQTHCECDSTSCHRNSSNTHNYDPNRLLTANVQYGNRTIQTWLSAKNQSNIGKMPVSLTEESFTAQDPVSTCIDILHSNILRLAQQKPKLRKPEWLRSKLTQENSCLKLKETLSRMGKIQPANRNSVISAKPVAFSHQHGSTESTPMTFQDTDRCGASSSHSSSQPCHSRPRSSKAEGELSEVLTNTLQWKQPAKRPLSACSMAMGIGTSGDGDSDGGWSDVSAASNSECSGCLPEAKRRKLSHYGHAIKSPGTEAKHRKGKRQNPPRELTAKQRLRCQKQRMLGRSLNLQCISCKHRIIISECLICTGGSLKAVKRHIKSVDTSVKAVNRSVRTVDRSLRTVKRSVRTVNGLVKTVNKPVGTVNRPVRTVDKPVRIVNKPVETVSKTVNKPVGTVNRPVRTVNKPLGTVNKPVNKLVRTVNKPVRTLNKSARAVNKPVKTVKKVVEAGNRPANSIYQHVKRSVKLVKQSVKTVNKSTKSGNKPTANDSSAAAKETKPAGQLANCSQLTSKCRKAFGRKNLHKNIPEADAKKQSRSKKDKHPLQPQKNTLRKNPKDKKQPIEKLPRKNGNSPKTNLEPSRPKEETLQEQQSQPCAGSVEMSILEQHRRLSSETSVLSSNQAFASARDMFSQLCRLEERSKGCDARTLEAIMPDKRMAGGNGFTKAVSVYSSSLPSSHVGGIWKSIFSGR